jgi:multidrug efflux pump subunit AcrB
VWLVRLALRRPFTVAAFCLLVLLMGALSAASMAVDLFPAIDIPVVVVVWNYPGMSAEDMERRITLLSERGISTSVSGVTRIDSQTITGTAVLRVYFEEKADIGGAIAQITSTSLTSTRVMPPGTQPPVILRYNASNVPVAQLTVSGTASEQKLFDYGLNFLRIRLFTIPGLSTPAPYGGKQRQLVVDLDPRRAAAAGVSPQDVVSAVLASNVILPTGTARIGNREYDVQLNGSPLTAEEFNAIPVKVVNDATVYLGDVAHVHDGFAVQTNVVRVDGRRASYLVILKKENASTLAVVDAARNLLPSIQAAAPEGIDLKLQFDQSKFVRGALSAVVREAVIAAGLVGLMILAFLGSWRSTVVVCISIPVSLLVALVGLKLTGQTLNLMTLGGLSLAIGMLVDDATVEIENINRNRRTETNLVRAILTAARQVALPALAATSTICVVFFPVVVLTGPARYLFTPLALSVVFAMAASYLLSRTLVPTLSALLLPKEEPEREEDTSRRRRALEALARAYARALAVTLERRRFFLVIVALFVVTSIFLVSVVGLDFFPRVDAGLMRIHFRAPAGTRIEQTELLVDAVEQHIRAIVPKEEIRTIDDNIGIPLFYNLGFVPSDNIDGADAEILVALTPSHHPTETYVRAIREAVSRDLPSSKIYFQQADIVGQVLNFGLSAPIDVQIESQDWHAALAMARRVESEVAQVSGTEDVRLAQVVNHPSLRIAVDRERAAQVGLAQLDVANSLLTSLSSSSLLNPSFWIDPKNNVNYQVLIQTPIERIHALTDIMTTPVTPGSHPLLPAPTATATGATPVIGANVAPYVGAFASVSQTESRAVVNHATVQPIFDVQCNVSGRDLGGVSRDIDRVVKSLGSLPKGMRINVRGQGDTMTRAFTALALGMVVAIALVYLLLVVLFQSWLDPFLIMLAVPGALSGILWFLVATGTTLNVQSFMGSIMAIGIAASNSILLVSFANIARVQDESKDPTTAAREAAETRLRPVLMTALAMILGMLPMALGLGEGGEQNAPLGRAVIGGLLVSTPMTLFVVPCAYALLRKKPPETGRRDREVAAAEPRVPGGG